MYFKYAHFGLGYIYIYIYVTIHQRSFMISALTSNNKLLDMTDCKVVDTTKVVVFSPWNNLLQLQKNLMTFLNF